MDTAVDIHSLKLMESMFMAGIEILIAERPSGYEDGDRLACGQVLLVLRKDTVLHGARMSWRNKRLTVLIGLSGHKGIVIVACRVTFGEIEGSEHMIIIVNLTTFLHS